MPTSQAYNDFLDALGLARSLLTLESKYPDPAPEEDRKTTEALRGGASVLMVAAFEEYLKALVEEHLDELTHFPLKFEIENIPEEMRFNNLEHLVVATTREKKEDKIESYDRMAKMIISGVIHPRSFTDAVRSNPDSKKLREMFKRFGIQDFFNEIKDEFDAKWKSPTAATYISDYLDQILSRRHKVAHTANALNISRHDLQESVRFLETLASVCDDFLGMYIKQILHPNS